MNTALIVILVILGVLALAGVVFANGISVFFATFIFYGLPLSSLLCCPFFTMKTEFWKILSYSESCADLWSAESISLAGIPYSVS